MRIEETTLGNIITTEGAINGMNIAPSDGLLMYEIIIKSLVEKLAVVKNKKDVKTAIRVQDLKGNFLIGFACEYEAPTEESDEDTGNWILTASFAEEDILKDCTSQPYEITDPALLIFIDEHASRQYNIKFLSNEFLIKLILTIFNALNTYIKENVKNVEESLEIENVAVIKYIAENDKIKKSIDLDGSLKRRIKDDAILSVPNVVKDTTPSFN